MSVLGPMEIFLAKKQLKIHSIVLKNRLQFTQIHDIVERDILFTNVL